MSINTGGIIADPNHVELFTNAGTSGLCGSAPKGELIHEKGKYCECKPSCTSLGMWHKNTQGSPTDGSMGNVITRGSLRNGKMSGLSLNRPQKRCYLGANMTISTRQLPLRADTGKPVSLRH